MVVVDNISNYDHLCVVQHPFTASKVDQIFMDNIFKLHGMPHFIVSDRDPIFTNNFWKYFFKLQGTQLHLNTAYNPQTDGKTKGVFHLMIKINGLDGYPQLNGGTTHLTILPLI